MTAAARRGSFGIWSAAAAYRCFTAATDSAYSGSDVRTDRRLEDAKLVRSPPGSTQVTLMPSAADLGGESVRPGGQGALGGRVHRRPGEADRRGDRRDVDDVPAALPAEVRQHRLRQLAALRRSWRP